MAETGSRGLAFGDGGRRPGAFVDIEIIPDDHVALLERRRELGAHIGVELVAIHGAIDDKSCGDGIASQAGDEGPGIPFGEGRVRLQTLASFAPATRRRHIGVDCVRRENDSRDRFLFRLTIDKDETVGTLLHRRLTMLAPFIAFPADIGAFALRCQQRFLYVKPARQSSFDRFDGSALTP